MSKEDEALEPPPYVSCSPLQPGTALQQASKSSLTVSGDTKKQMKCKNCTKVFKSEMPAVLQYIHNLRLEIVILLKPQMNIKLR